jgi:hypothetical protein
MQSSALSYCYSLCQITAIKIGGVLGVQIQAAPNNASGMYYGTISLYELYTRFHGVEEVGLKGHAHGDASLVEGRGKLQLLERARLRDKGNLGPHRLQGLWTDSDWVSSLFAFLHNNRNEIRQPQRRCPNRASGPVGKRNKD